MVVFVGASRFLWPISHVVIKGRGAVTLDNTSSVDETSASNAYRSKTPL